VQESRVNMAEVSDVGCLAVLVPEQQGLEQEPTVYAAGLKRAVDVVFGCLALVVCLPLITIIAVLIMLESPGAPFYRQSRVGVAGREFEIFKLRTMFTGADALAFKTDHDDPRVTPLGRILRAAKIDELPQLINIVRGEMSIVGPRPLSTEECRYIIGSGFDVFHRGFFLTVKPGLIGLEQLNRAVGLNYADRFALNHLYERSMSWRVDVHVFVRSLVQCYRVCMLVAAAGLAECAMLGQWLSW
jgi:lipopolysaccharide/colanic/teichoic acid biosynthesis glycosyltransferase